MDNQPLVNETIHITNIELKEVKRKDGTTFKQFSVTVVDQPRGTFYTLPIYKAPKKNEDGTVEDGGFTKAYEFYKENKSAWEDIFISGGSIPVEIAYSERTSDWKTKEGKKMTSTYRTIRMIRDAVEVDDAADIF